MDCYNYSTAQKVRISHYCSQFLYSEPFYSIIFPPGSYLIQLYGASGGYTRFETEISPGKGGYTKGVLTLKETEKFFLFIGGEGGNTTKEASSEGGLPGYNGGARGANDNGRNKNCPSAGGGGATDLRTVSGDWNLTEGLQSRIMVAGGGGSGGCYTQGGSGGDGGGITGGEGSPNGHFLSVEGGKGGGQYDGSFGMGTEGEPGVLNQNGEAGGSGGGGYYGGFGGQTSGDAASGSGGGGGSSFISGLEGCVAYGKNISSSDRHVHSSGFIFNKPVTTPGMNLGNGYAIIIRIGSITSTSNFYVNCVFHFITLLYSPYS